MYDEERLSSLARGNPLRQHLYDTRKLRMRTRARQIECDACGEKEYSRRDSKDICAACLSELWSSRDTIAQLHANKAGKGLSAFKMTRTPHNLPYPALSTSYDYPPKEASFYRGERSGADNVCQILFSELFKSLSELLPVPPDQRSEAAGFLSTNWSEQGNYYASLSFDLAKALNDLWYFIQWHSSRAYDKGVEVGNDWVSGLLLGTLTTEQMNDKIAEQTKRAHERQAKAVKGVRNQGP